MAEPSNSPGASQPPATAAPTSAQVEPTDAEVEDEEVRNSVKQQMPLSASTGDDQVMADAPASSGTSNGPNTQDTLVAPSSSGMTLDGTNDASSQNNAAAAAAAASSSAPANVPSNAEEIAELEARIPQKKDATLREFLGKMDDYAPIIPDAVTNYYLTLAGLPPPPQTPLPLARLLALATQKFISDIAADAYQYARIRSSNTSSSSAAAAMGMTSGAGVPGVMGSANAAAAAAVAAGGLSAAGGLAATKDGDKGTGGSGSAAKAAHLGMQRPGYGGGGQGTGQGRTVLTMEDLGMAVGEYGVNVKRGEFYR